MISRLRNQFSCRGAAIEPSPAFQRREQPPRSASRGATIERRLSKTRRASVLLHREIVRRFCWSTVALRLLEIIARFPALKRRAKIKSRSAAGSSSFFASIKSRSAAGVFFSLLAFFASSLHSFSAPGRGLIHNQPISFADITQSVKIAFKHENGASAEKLMVETFGSGVAWLDYDNDGFLDLFFANGANLSAGKPSPGNALLRNTGNGTFVDVTRSAGLRGDGGFSAGVAVGDYDNDGFLDLYVTGYGANALYRNNGNGTFTDVTAKAGVKGGGWSSSAGFFDYDRAGDLDLYVVRYLDYDVKENVYCGYQKPGYRMYCDPRGFDGVPDLLYRNNGDGTFTDVSKKAGVANPAGKGLGVAFGDFDNDGWLDLFVTNFSEE